MEPITLILTALKNGAEAVTKVAVGEAVKKAYNEN